MKGTSYEDQYTFFILTRSFLEWEMLQTKFVAKIKTDILCSVPFFSENRAVCEKIWKTIVERGRPHDNMAHAHCVLDT
jgi:hypothetical protein